MDKRAVVFYFLRHRPSFSEMKMPTRYKLNNPPIVPDYARCLFCGDKAGEWVRGPFFDYYVCRRGDLRSDVPHDLTALAGRSIILETPVAASSRS